MSAQSNETSSTITEDQFCILSPGLVIQDLLLGLEFRILRAPVQSYADSCIVHRSMPMRMTGWEGMHGVWFELGIIARGTEGALMRGEITGESRRNISNLQYGLVYIGALFDWLLHSHCDNIWYNTGYFGMRWSSFRVCIFLILGGFGLWSVCFFFTFFFFTYLFECIPAPIFRSHSFKHSPKFSILTFVIFSPLAGGTLFFTSTSTRSSSFILPTFSHPTRLPPRFFVRISIRYFPIRFSFFSLYSTYSPLLPHTFFPLSTFSFFWVLGYGFCARIHGSNMWNVQGKPTTCRFFFIFVLLSGNLRGGHWQQELFFFYSTSTPSSSFTLSTLSHATRLPPFFFWISIRYFSIRFFFLTLTLLSLHSHLTLFPAFYIFIFLWF